VFNEFHAIVCRNVMIYFDRSLQRRVFQLFHDSLVRFGVLGLGHRETIRYSGFEQNYQELDGVEKLWKRVA
jgi:chemotaxis protein methyltransferase CheR